MAVGRGKRPSDAKRYGFIGQASWSESVSAPRKLVCAICTLLESEPHFGEYEGPEHGGGAPGTGISAGRTDGGAGLTAVPLCADPEGGAFLQRSGARGGDSALSVLPPTPMLYAPQRN